MIRCKRDYPKRVRVGNVWYRVRFPRTPLWLDGEAVSALCHLDIKMIDIGPGLDPEDRWELFWHEILHALAHEFGFRLAHPTIYNLQEALAQFKAQNPRL